MTTSILNEYKEVLFLFVLLLVVILISLASSRKEGFQNPLSPAPNADVPLLDSFPSTGKKYVNKNTYNDIWWYYPIFGVGSYDQVTNNLKYRRNPDDGQCITADFCGTLYRDNQIATNITLPLPPVPNIPGTRVNYYRTPENLFMGDQPGKECPLPAF